MISTQDTKASNRFSNDSIVECLRRHAADTPDKIYIRIFGAKETKAVSFGELWRDCLAFQGFLPAEAIGKTCLIFLPQDYDIYAAFFGAMTAGAVPALMPCPSSKQHPSIYWPSHADLIKVTKPGLILTDEHHAAQMKENGLADLGVPILTIETFRSGNFAGQNAGAPNWTHGHDTAFLQHSSGTTGLKKGVMLSHAAVLDQVASYADALQFGTDSVIASWLPLYHDMGLISSTVMPAIVGSTVNFVDPFLWTMRPFMIFKMIEETQANFSWMPNFAFEHLCRTVNPERMRFDLSSMKGFISCSEPSKDDTIDRFIERFSGFGVKPEMMQVCYAMAETVFAVSQTPYGERAKAVCVNADALREQHIAEIVPADHPSAMHIVSTGPVIDGLETRIYDDARKEIMTPNAVGEIGISGRFLFNGYYNRDEVTQERIVGDTYFTRDKGFMLDGELYVLGRVDDLIIINGKNIYAHEVEGLMGRFSELKGGRTVAMGIYNPRIGSQELVLMGETKDPVAETDTDALQARISDLVFDNMSVRPVGCLLVDQGTMIKTTSGKISRHANEKLYRTLTS